MRTLIAALAVTAGILAAALPASAGYTSPDAGWQQKAFSVGQN